MRPIRLGPPTAAGLREAPADRQGFWLIGAAAGAIWWVRGVERAA
jgi:hypothetical protein